MAMDRELTTMLAWGEDMSTNPQDMTDEEIELRLILLERKRLRAQGKPLEVPVAAESAATYDTAEGPIVRVAERRKSSIVPEPRWKNTVKKCPHCGKEKKVDPDFGVILSRGTQYAASWCKQCRSETASEYRSKPRKNASVNSPIPPKKPKKK